MFFFPSLPGYKCLVVEYLFLVPQTKSSSTETASTAAATLEEILPVMENFKKGLMVPKKNNIFNSAFMKWFFVYVLREFKN